VAAQGNRAVVEFFDHDDFSVVKAVGSTRFTMSS
jgi:hypothetical protein